MARRADGSGITGRPESARDLRTGSPGTLAAPSTRGAQSAASADGPACSRRSRVAAASPASAAGSRFGRYQAAPLPEALGEALPVEPAEAPEPVEVVMADPAGETIHQAAPKPVLPWPLVCPAAVSPVK